MKHFNKILSILLIVCLTLSLFSCAEKLNSNEDAAIIDNADSEQPNGTSDDKADDTSKNNLNSNDTENKIETETNIPDNTNNDENVKDDSSENEQQVSTDEKPSQTPDKNQTIDTDKKDEPNTNDKPETDDTVIVDEYKPEIQFTKYQSNTSVPTGNHFVLVSQNKTKKTFRGVFPVQEYGSLEYCFYFSNNVDSTWAKGDIAYRDMPTESYKIVSAAIMTTKNDSADTVNKRTKITFENKESKTVESGEMFWSDPVTYTVSKGEYLVFEWTVEYTMIPCNRNNGTGIVYESNNGIAFSKPAEGAPMPNMIGAARNKSVNIAFIGDSITAGEKAGVFNGYVAQISNQLGENYSVWNLGLGYARANDVVNSPAWLKKAKTASTVAICFGVNDINSGAYDLGKRTADEIVSDIAYIAKEVSDAGAHVVIFSTPPYTYANDERITKWRDVVSKLQRLAADNDYSYFDFASCLGSPSDPSVPAYGGHPNGEGCTVVANAFIKAYNNGNIELE